MEQSRKKSRLSSQLVQDRQPFSIHYQQQRARSADSLDDDSLSTVVTSTVTSIPPRISYLASYGIVICVVYQTAMLPGRSFETHWRAKHQLQGSSLRALLDYEATINCRNPYSVDLPPHGSQPIPELGAPVEGFRYPDCPFLTTNKKHWQRHMSQNRHRASGHIDEYRVRLQSFSGGGFARYWIVRDSIKEGAY